jgi:hypothetical protein
VVAPRIQLPLVFKRYHHEPQSERDQHHQEQRTTETAAQFNHSGNPFNLSTYSARKMISQSGDSKQTILPHVLMRQIEESRESTAEGGRIIPRASRDPETKVVGLPGEGKPQAMREGSKTSIMRMY